MSNFSGLSTLLNSLVPTACPTLQLTVNWRGQTVFQRAAGWLDPVTRTHPATDAACFDLASVTKLFVATAIMRLADEERLAVEDPVVRFIDGFDDVRPVQPYEDPLHPGAWVQVESAFTSVQAASITLRRLLTHTSGLPAWRPLFRTASADEARAMAVKTGFACGPGEHVLYSDIGLILLGMVVEAVHGQPLDQALHELVLAPLGLDATHYRRLSAPQMVPPDACAPTEFCRWRKRRIQGAVHDENAYRLDGVAGHAGLFSTSQDVAALGQFYLDQVAASHAPAHVPGHLVQPATVADMIREQAREGARRRGLGFVLWSPDGATPTFSPSTFGHTGFTGTSLWIDPPRQVVIALLTNEVYNGRQQRGIAALREAVHRTVLQAIDHTPDTKAGRP